MPMHAYDGLRKLRDLLNEELRKRRKPGIFKIRTVVSNNDVYHGIHYYSFIEYNIEPESLAPLMRQVMRSFKFKCPDLYSLFTSTLKNEGKIRYPF
jgi:hypothetical protein